jgi:hypothetical protein
MALVNTCFFFPIVASFEMKKAVLGTPDSLEKEKPANKAGLAQTCRHTLGSLSA